MKSTNTTVTAGKGTSKIGLFERFSSSATKATGSTPAFLIAFAIILVWAAAGPFFGFSETWQLVINTGTTIITFLMVFLIQKAQNKDSLAIQLKLNELVAAHSHASNRLVDAENISEDELKTIQEYYSKLSELSKKDESLLQSHSIDEAEEAQNEKRKAQHIKPQNAAPKAAASKTAAAIKPASKASGPKTAAATKPASSTKAVPPKSASKTGTVTKPAPKTKTAAAATKTKTSSTKAVATKDTKEKPAVKKPAASKTTSTKAAATATNKSK